MIESAQEFIRLRDSEVIEEYTRSAQEEASMETWLEVIVQYPEYREWVVHNKMVPLAILEILTIDGDQKVRYVIARKRKISDWIVDMLATDEDESVRIALVMNSKTSREQVLKIDRAGSDWFVNELDSVIARRFG